MKRLALVAVSSAILLSILLSAVGCSRDAKADFYEEYDNAGGAIEENEKESMEPLATTASAEKTLAEGRKIIENVELHIQTKDFSNLLTKIENEIASLGGYVEESRANGLDPNSQGYRNAHLIVRIPVKSSSKFDEFLSKNSVITSRTVSTEDVTLQYVDMESRIKALTIEKESLEEILKKAVSVEEIIAIRSQLTNVIHEIESYQSKLRTFDNLVDYSTVTIYINEVERTAIVEKQNIWQKIGTNLVNGFENVGKALVELFVFAISAIPYLIPFAVIAAFIIIPIKIKKIKKKKAEAKSEEKE